MKKLISLFLIVFLYSCSNTQKFGAGVDISYDPRSIGMIIDDTIMQKKLSNKIFFNFPTQKKNYILVSSEVIDGRIFISGKVDDPEDKIKITKMAWETRGVRSVENAITIKGQTNFKSTAKDILITSQLRSALIFNKNIKSRNYSLETVNKNIYIFGIAIDEEEKKEVINEANKIFEVESVVPSIYLISELSRNKN